MAERESNRHAQRMAESEGDMRKRRANQSGNSLLEFTFVGIPLIFTLISTFEISRGMWLYETLAHAVRGGVRYAIVHGLNCRVTPNGCQVHVSDVATVISNAGVGLLPDQMRITLMQNGNYKYNSGSSVTLTTCLSDTTTAFPNPNGEDDDAPGLNVTIAATYPFQSAIVMFWPGGRSVGPFGTFNFGATSTERIEF